ncbi:hypothetical protein ACFL2G_05430, partial [Candidatus Omnitrophota bacterium]
YLKDILIAALKDDSTIAGVVAVLNYITDKDFNGSDFGLTAKFSNADAINLLQSLATELVYSSTTYTDSEKDSFKSALEKVTQNLTLTTKTMQAAEYTSIALNNNANAKLDNLNANTLVTKSDLENALTEYKSIISLYKQASTLVITDTNKTKIQHNLSKANYGFIKTALLLYLFAKKENDNDAADSYFAEAQDALKSVLGTSYRVTETIDVNSPNLFTDNLQYGDLIKLKDGSMMIYTYAVDLPLIDIDGFVYSGGSKLTLKLTDLTGGETLDSSRVITAIYVNPATNEAEETALIKLGEPHQVFFRTWNKYGNTNKGYCSASMLFLNFVKQDPSSTVPDMDRVVELFGKISTLHANSENGTGLPTITIKKGLVTRYLEKIAQKVKSLNPFATDNTKMVNWNAIPEEGVITITWDLFKDSLKEGYLKIFDKNTPTELNLITCEYSSVEMKQYVSHMKVGSFSNLMDRALLLMDTKDLSNMVDQAGINKTYSEIGLNWIDQFIDEAFSEIISYADWAKFEEDGPETFKENLKQAIRDEVGATNMALFGLVCAFMDDPAMRSFTNKIKAKLITAKDNLINKAISSGAQIGENVTEGFSERSLQFIGESVGRSYVVTNGTEQYKVDISFDSAFMLDVFADVVAVLGWLNDEGIDKTLLDNYMSAVEEYYMNDHTLGGAERIGDAWNALKTGSDKGSLKANAKLALEGYIRGSGEARFFASMTPVTLILGPLQFNLNSMEVWVARGADFEISGKLRFDAEGEFIPTKGGLPISEFTAFDMDENANVNVDASLAIKGYKTDTWEGIVGLVKGPVVFYLGGGKKDILEALNLKANSKLTVKDDGNAYLSVQGSYTLPSGYKITRTKNLDREQAKNIISSLIIDVRTVLGGDINGNSEIFMDKAWQAMLAGKEITPGLVKTWMVAAGFIKESETKEEKWQQICDLTENFKQQFIESSRLSTDYTSQRSEIYGVSGLGLKLDLLDTYWAKVNLKPTLFISGEESSLLELDLTGSYGIGLNLPINMAGTIALNYKKGDKPSYAMGLSLINLYRSDALGVFNKVGATFAKTLRMNTFARYFENIESFGNLISFANNGFSLGMAATTLDLPTMLGAGFGYDLSNLSWFSNLDAGLGFSASWLGYLGEEETLQTNYGANVRYKDTLFTFKYDTEEKTISNLTITTKGMTESQTKFTLEIDTQSKAGKAGIELTNFKKAYNAFKKYFPIKLKLGGPEPEKKSTTPQISDSTQLAPPPVWGGTRSLGAVLADLEKAGTLGITDALKNDKNLIGEFYKGLNSIKTNDANGKSYLKDILIEALKDDSTIAGVVAILNYITDK